MATPNRFFSWVDGFPTTNGKILLGMLLVALIVVAALVAMLIGRGVDEGVLTIILSAAIALSGIATWQKVQKWKAMPESAEEEPPAPPPSGGA